jgi:hypothetical protein
VFDDFRFHMTLTGPVEPARQESVVAWLRKNLGAIEGRPMPVDSIALMHQPNMDTPFHVVTTATLAAH